MTQNIPSRGTAITAIWIVCGLIILSGCQSFSRWSPSRDDERRGTPTENGPALKHQPATIENMLSSVGGQPDLEPPTAPSATPTGATNSGGQINLEDVGLAADAVHVEAGMPIEEIDSGESSQLPEFIESAVHPYGQITPPIVSPEAFRNRNPGTPVAEDTGPGEPVTGVISDSIPPMATVADTATLQPPVTVPSGTRVSSATPVPSAAPETAATGTDATEPAVTTTAGNDTNNTARTATIIPAVTAPQSAAEQEVIKLVGKSQAEEPVEISQELDSLLTPPGADSVGMSLGDQPPGAVAQFGDTQIPDSVSPAAPPVRAVGLNQPDVHNANNAPAAAALATQATPRQLTWQEQLQASIEMLDQQLQDPAAARPEGMSQIRRHLLQLVAGTAQPGSFEINGMSDVERDYWQQQLTSIQVMLNGLPDEDPAASGQMVQRRRATAAVSHLDQAASQLARQATLQIENATFCTQVHGFGDVTAAGRQFVANQPMLIYCEIENYGLRPATPNQAGQQQFVAELRGQYVIIDSRNEVVQQHQFQSVQDTTHVRRKDFYMYFPLAIPELPPGRYRLQLSVEDLVGNKFSSARPDLEFTIINAPATGQGPRTAGRRPIDRR